MEIVRSLARRIAEMEAVARKNAAQAEALDAKADFVAMMTDVDLTLLDDEEMNTNEPDVSEG